MSDETQTEAEVDEMVDDILEQLKNSTKICTDLSKPSAEIHLHKEDVEQFAIDTSAEAVKTALEAVSELKDRAIASTDPEDVRAFADVMKATAAMIEAMNKLHISSERNKTSRANKQDDIKSRQVINRDNNDTKIMLTRQEVMAHLFKKQNTSIEAEVVED